MSVDISDAHLLSETVGEVTFSFLGSMDVEDSVCSPVVTTVISGRPPDAGEVILVFFSVGTVVIPRTSSVVAVVIALLLSVVNRVTSSISLSVLLDGISGVTEVLSVTDDVTCSLIGEVVELVISSLLATEEDDDSIPSLTS